MRSNSDWPQSVLSPNVTSHVPSPQLASMIKNDSVKHHATLQLASPWASSTASCAAVRWWRHRTAPILLLIQPSLRPRYGITRRRTVSNHRERFFCWNKREREQKQHCESTSCRDEQTLGEASTAASTAAAAVSITPPSSAPGCAQARAVFRGGGGGATD